MIRAMIDTHKQQTAGALMGVTLRRMIVMAFMRMMIFVTLAILGSGCGEDEQASVCTLGELQACPCLDGEQGVQECSEDRQGWEQCQCEIGEDQREDSGGEERGGAEMSGEERGGADMSGEESGGTESGGAMSSGTESSGTESSGTDSSSGTESSGTESGGEDSDVVTGRDVTIWAHTFNGTLGPGSGLQPGNMETEGAQGFSDGGSWISNGGWLSKTISTVGYTTIEVDYLLTKDPNSTCELNMSTDGGSTWTNILSDRGPGGYRLNATLPASAEGERRLLMRWTSETAWCWMNEIIITAFDPEGVERSNQNDEMDATGDAGAMETNSVFHVFLLMGQSNMVGCDVITQDDRITDERISVLGYETCSDTGRVFNEWDSASPPLHSCTAGVGPGDYFAKTLVEALPEGHTMGLVPTAVSGQWIETFLQGGVHHQSILDKIQLAAGVENARFSGIIFHQGESNNGDPSWPGKVQQLYTQIKAAMGIDYDIPFIAGEMLHGGSCEGHNTLVHQVPNLGDNFDYVSAEGLVMAPGDQWLVHFDYTSQVTLGRRYGEKMRAALGW